MDLDMVITVLKYHLELNGRLFEISKDGQLNRINIKNKLTLEERDIDFNEIKDFLQYNQYEYDMLVNGLSFLALKTGLLDKRNVDLPDSPSVKGKLLLESPSSIVDKVNNLIDNEKDTIYLLLIGITGVGKSTFINMVVNYIKYGNLEQALNRGTLDNIYTIPSKINIQDEDRTHNINLGDVSGIKTGSSVTQFSKQYKFLLPNGKILCLIDAPGVGDPQGPLQDDLHFENILHEISTLKKLNGICILMRPDETRAHVLFKYCLNQLLIHLHASAKDNIFFCFTHTRGTMYKPGPTKTLLEDHLDKMKDQSNNQIDIKDRIFCFDNESFNFLAAKLHGETNFSEDDEYDFSRSWDRSSKEFQRLLSEISKVQPHDVAGTVCLNNARTMIGNLAQPMSTCISSINNNIKLIEKQSEKMVNSNFKESEVFIPESVIKIEMLEKNIIVCSRSECSSSTDNPCKIGVPPQRWYVPLYKYDNFNAFGICKSCSNPNFLPCLSLFHKTVSIKETSTTNQISSDKQTIVSEIEQRKKQYNEEYEIIKNAIVDFSVFLWHHTLIKVNSYYEEYINLQIKELEVAGSYDLILKLNDHLKEYLARVEEQKKNVQNNSAKVKTQKEIFDIFDTLCNLPMVGYIIRDNIKLKKRSHSKSEVAIIDLRN
ncbi:hypothetical protein ACTA71_002560 [Dictyostelium dimigraforme]